jgi:dTDP-4-dehydrorhamnose 3,5-epimerase
MKISELNLKGVFEIILEPKIDSRGFFMRTYDKEIFKQHNINREWVQENHTLSEKKGTIRGLHFQFPPFAETKLLRCIHGAIYDVFVDLRKDSPTFGKWGSIELTAQNKKMVLIPRGFAHGFCTLTDNSEILYKVDNYYNANAECGIIWNDSDLQINWPVKQSVISDKDSKNINFKQFQREYAAIDVGDKI